MSRVSTRSKEIIEPTFCEIVGLVILQHGFLQLLQLCHDITLDLSDALATTSGEQKQQLSLDPTIPTGQLRNISYSGRLQCFQE